MPGLVGLAIAKTSDTRDSRCYEICTTSHERRSGLLSAHRRKPIEEPIATQDRAEIVVHNLVEKRMFPPRASPADSKREERPSVS